MGGASLKAIKERIKSVEGTMQITKAMELVATSKLQHAREQVERARPFYETLLETIETIESSCPNPRSPYFAQRQIGKTCYIVIGGDRGLAGGFNNNVFKTVANHAEESGRAYCVLPIGKKCYEHFLHRRAEILAEEPTEAQDVGVGACFDIGKVITEGFLRGEYDRVFVCYSKFISMMSQEPKMEQLLPLYVEPSDNKRLNLTIYEPGEEEILDVIVPSFLSGMIYGALCESLAAEQAARRMAMSSASDNAQEIKDELTLEYNRARQSVITQEITEIVAGAENN